MRHDECSEYFKVYEDNAKMLICVKDDKLLGRALIWEIDGKTYMDRIYTCMDFLEPQFIDYAQEHKWYRREENSLLSDGDYQYWVGPEDGYKQGYHPELKIVLDKVYKYMPYMDSFRYYNMFGNSISTIPFSGAYNLSNTEGYYGEDDDDIALAYCAYCDFEERYYIDDGPENLYWSDYNECYYCENCAIYCDGLNDYVGPRDTVVNVYYTRELSNTYPLEYVKDNPDDFILVNDIWWMSSSHLVEEDDEGNYYIKDE